jgi:hypothetical protein
MYFDGEKIGPEILTDLHVSGLRCEKAIFNAFSLCLKCGTDFIHNQYLKVCPS